MKKITLLINLLIVLFASSASAQAPVVAITSNRTNICPTTAINFTDQSTNNPTSWSWSFPGGTPNNSNAQNPGGIVYNVSGSYDVILTATNASGSTLLTFTDFISVQDCRISTGIYRIPYVDGTEVRITRDHIDHAPSPLRIDMVGTNGTAPYQIAAAADGWVRAIVDNFSGCCSQFGNCSDCNNYVWMEHPNGEWTKYTHFRPGTVTGAAGLVVDTFICAGTYLGDEGDVGASSGSGRAAVACDGNVPLQTAIDSLNTVNIGNGQDSIRCGVHLHFEVGIPDDPANPFTTTGGFLIGQNIIPVICDIPGNIFESGDVFTANPCDLGSCDDDLVLENQNFGESDIGVFQADNTITAENNFVVTADGNVLLSAGDQVVLGPGFRALSDSYFIARIENCNKSPGDVCNIGLRVAITESEITNVGNRIAESGLVVYPNPVVDNLNIIYMVGKESSVNLKVVNIYGQEMLKLSENTRREAGTVHRILMDTGIMPPGTYYCILQAGHEFKVARFLKVN